ncbi:type II secretion system F family protein [Bacillus daqingensis]|uniref:Type II secretion system F family protein n=1 Tax=Bacillus daqingensis TaxID=872396 RepID=A0ABV9NVA7_9BACI
MLYAAAGSLFLFLFLSMLAAAQLLRPADGASPGPSLKETLKSSNRRMKALIVRRGRKSRRKKLLEQRLSVAGLPIKPEEFVVFKLFAVIIVSALLYIAEAPLLLLIAGAGGVYAMAEIWLNMRRKKRIRQFNEGFPDMVASIIGSLKAGFSLPQSLQMVAEESYPPIQEEVELVIKAMQYGKNIEEAMIDWKERMPSDDLDLFVEAVLIQRQVGGNLAYLLERIVETTRERARMEGQIRTLTAQGKLSGLVVGLLPVGLAFVISAINPVYMETLLTNEIGRILLAGAAVSSLIGFLSVRKITAIEV